VAKKPQTPQPPRRVQAPKTRSNTPAGDDGRRTRAIIYAVAAAGVIALAIVGIIVATSGGGDGGSGNSGKVADLMKAADCTFKTVDAEVPKGKSTHVASLTAKLDWNTFPPSNGQHYPQWAVWDFYSQPVNPRMVVHNEEHGGVILWWGEDAPQATVDALNKLYTEDPAGMLGTPIAGFDGKVAITAWTGDPNRYTQDGYYGQGHIATCTSYTNRTADAFRAFRDAYRDHGPEGVPISANQPGMGPG
jgi:Protein of unknown function (DUF3105)